MSAESRMDEGETMTYVDYVSDVQACSIELSKSKMHSPLFLVLCLLQHIHIVYINIYQYVRRNREIRAFGESGNF